MNLQLVPAKLRGTVPAIASKSMAHRLLICAALGSRPVTLSCPDRSRDIEATARCLRAMGADIQATPEGCTLIPGPWRSPCSLPCGESGSTLRFLLPMAGALGLEAEFSMEGRLPQRPLFPLDRELEAHGLTLERPREDLLRIRGQLRPGDYRLPGNVSSQFISGLLLALPLLSGTSTLTVTGRLESSPYVGMTLSCLKAFGISLSGPPYHISPAPFSGPGELTVEGDWSNAAFWLAANTLGSDIQVTGLSRSSLQGDRAIASLLPKLGSSCLADVSNTPDLVPILAVAAAVRPGETHFVGAGRLRMKESDRIATVCAMLRNLGVQVREETHSLTVTGGPLTGGVVDAAGDHRIAMAAAIAATAASGPVTLLGAQAVEKSYPRFWQDYRALGGIAKEVTP